MNIVERLEIPVSVSAGGTALVGVLDMKGSIIALETVPYNAGIKIYLKSIENDATVFQSAGKGFYGLPGTVLLWPRFKLVVENTSQPDYNGKIVIKFAKY